MRQFIDSERERIKVAVHQAEQGATDAICDAIARCGVLLAQVSPAGPGTNPDELPDELIQEP